MGCICGSQVGGADGAAGGSSERIGGTEEQTERRDRSFQKLRYFRATAVAAARIVQIYEIKVPFAGSFDLLSHRRLDQMVPILLQKNATCPDEI